MKEEAGDGFARIWAPQGETRGVMLCLHGSESHAGWFAPLGSLLPPLGYAVYAFDRPGWGAAPGAAAGRGHLESYAAALAEVERHARLARRRFGPVHLVGMSWGGLLALYAALRRGALFDSVALLAPGLSLKKDFALRCFARLPLAFARRRWTECFPLAFAPEDFTGDSEWRRNIAADPLATRAVSAGFALATLQMRRFIHEHAGRRAPPPTLALLGSHDAIVHNPRAAALAARCGAAVRTYTGARHALLFEAPRRLAADLAEWAARAAQTPATGGRALVMGAGAVGQAVGALLALAGHRTTLLGRPAQTRAINERGVRLRLGGGERDIGRAHGLTALEASAEAIPERAAAVPEPPDLAILAVKSYDTPAAIEALRPLIGPRTVLLSFQNGLGNEPLLAAAFPDNAILAGACCAYLDLAAPGTVAWADDRGGLAAGAYHDPAGAAEEAWRFFFDPLRMETSWCAGRRGGPGGGMRVKWSKLPLNVAFNAINAATGQGPGEILRDRLLGGLAARALRETFAAMRRRRIAPVDLPGYPVRLLAGLARLPAGWLRPLLAWRLARENSGASSMRQDRLRGKAVSEIADINGAVAAAAAEAGLAAPANEEIIRRFSPEVDN